VSGDDYLWDGSGTPDPDAVRLERLLARYRYRPGEERLARTEPARSPLRLVVSLVGALAAGLLLWFGFGGAELDGYRVIGIDDVSVARVGDWLTAGDGVAELEIGDLGSVQLEPGTRLRVDDTGKQHHGLFLEKGAIHAEISALAAPRAFQVGSPAGLTIDLGCEYSLEVMENGDTELAVQTGQVSFAFNGREVYVPASAACRSQVGRGPTPPMFDSMPDEKREYILTLHELGAQTGKGGVLYEFGMLKSALDFTDREDALPLFAMMTDPYLDYGLRDSIYERLEDTFYQPPGITKAGILGGDEKMREEWLVEFKRYW